MREKKSEYNEEIVDCPPAKKRKGFQKDIRLFIKKGVCLDLNNIINASNPRNLVHSETGPPTQDSATEHGVVICVGEETLGLATVQCEYNTITVSTPTVQADVTINHKMGLGTAGQCMGVKTKACVSIPPPPTISVDVGGMRS